MHILHLFLKEQKVFFATSSTSLHVDVASTAFMTSYRNSIEITSNYTSMHSHNRCTTKIRGRKNEANEWRG